MSDLIDVRIDRLGGAGDGVATTADGDKLHVAGALPGERARVKRTAKDRGDLIEILGDESRDRAAPPCPHADACGGCTLQHVTPDALARWKRQRIVDALSHQKLDTEVAETITVPQGSRRRVRFAARRLKSGVLLGFHGRRSHQVVAINQCLVARPALVEALPMLSRLARLAAPRNRTIGLSVLDSGSGLDIALEDGKPLDLDSRQDAALWAEEAEVARLTWNGELIALRRPPQIRAGNSVLTPPAGSFLQAAAEGEQALANFTLQALAGADRVADLYCGSGAFALRLASRSEVLALDGDAEAITALDAAWRGSGGALRRVEAIARDLFRRPLRPSEMKGLDGAVFDPPRAGAAAQAEQLAAAPFDRLVGISCNPASFARDAAVLASGGWRLTRVQPVDQFLFSPHVELAALFQRE